MPPSRPLHVVQLLSAMICFLGPSGNESRAEESRISFNRDIRPILSDRCFKCHGPDATNQDSEFRLDTFDHAVADLGGYAGIVPGNLEASEFHARIHSDDESDQMPPPGSLRGLTASEKKLLDRWIEEGAVYEGHWSFQRLPQSVSVPKPIVAEKTGPAEEPDWGRGVIDQFIERGLNENGFKPNRPATREKWLRRVTFDLTGLPPTLEEIDEFLEDGSPEAHEKVVDRLLQTTACAERLTAEWLDVARYSDSYGYQRDDERFVWPWRDWVIRAFKDNMPYDRFITLQVAGDLVPGADRDDILATTFNRLHSHKKEGGVALEEFRIENVADRTHTIGSAFLGLTLECCRCHDHKYDPLTMKDYYQLTSFFANVDERGLISYFTDAVPTPAMPLPSADQERDLERADRAVLKAEERLAECRRQGTAEFETWWRQQVDQSEGNPSPIPDRVAKVSFEGWENATEEESVTEVGKPGIREKTRALVMESGDDHGEVPGKRAITTVENRLIPGVRGQGIHLSGDDAVVLPGVGHFGRHQPFSVSLWIRPAELSERAVIYRRSRGWDDAGTIGYELTKERGRLSAKLVHFWPGNALCVETDELLKEDEWQHVVVTYDGSSRARGVAIYVNGQAVSLEVVQDSLTRNITQWRQGYDHLAIGSRYRDRGFKDGRVDEFQVFDRQLSKIEARHLHDGLSLSFKGGLLKTASPEPRKQELREYFLSAHHQSTREAVAELTRLRAERNAAADAIPAITIMREQPAPRPAYILERGVYDQRGEEVAADTPAFLPDFPTGAPRNRLGLARWLTAPDHPLTARVAVNRYWQLMFGNGLVRTPEDFGNQGEPPTHPELLDWLSRDFVDHGWDVRRLLKSMALSATYLQDASVDAAKRDADPENRWYARGPGQRLSAEMIRDNVLATSGLLVDRVGGPPVKPYDVALAYTPLPVDEGEKLYRRSLYTFWKRTSPSPVMMTLNASKREVCRLRREVANSPLQALVMLNGPQFTEAAQAMASKLLDESDGEIETLIARAFRMLTGREALEAEARVLRSLFDDQLVEYTEHPELAAQLLAKPEAISVPAETVPAETVPAEKGGKAEKRATEDRKQAGDQSEAGDEVTSGQGKQGGARSSSSDARLAAATILINTMMNLDESVRHQ